MRFASDTVRAFRQYTKESLTENELKESRKLVRDRRSRHSEEQLTESEQKRRDKILLEIVESRRSRGDVLIEPRKQPAQSSDYKRPATQYLPKL